MSDDDRALKTRHRAMWASGDFPRVSRETVAGVGPALVEAAGVAPGMQVLDVAAGSGNAAIAAAVAGADVVASDLTPEMFDAGRADAAAAGVTLAWVEADAEALPFDDASFDVVLSSFGAMFGPRHQVVADELLRVCRPGGTIAMANWTPEGWVGRFFVVQAPFMPPPPPGALPPILWGREDHVRELFGDRVSALGFERRTAVVDAFATPEELVQYYRDNFGPTILAYRAVADDPERRAQLDAGFLQLARDGNLAGPGEPARYAFEYLLVVARRA
jgi:ubiquinone/menaquinone biosynthesis C-methylase UbiE